MKLDTKPAEDQLQISDGRLPIEDQSAIADSGAEKFSRVDQVYQEFCRRREQGEPLDPDDYCDQFPAMKSALRRLVHAQVYLEENSVFSAKKPVIRWPEAGETFLEFHLKLQLGKGAFARVFLATEPKLGNRLVAVKIAERGGAEAEILGPIKHPNIVPVFSVQEDRATGLTAVCMPYVGAATLHDVLDHAFRSSRRPAQARVILDAVKDLPYPLDPSHSAAPEAVLRNGTYIDGIRLIGARLADALAFLHESGICHRDLKPSNVLMSPEGVPMLLDFNLCTDPNETVNLLGGTMSYMSPEQLRATDKNKRFGFATLDARSDIFSLGVILYQLVTGVHPFGPPPLKLSSADLCPYLLERQQQGPIEARRTNPEVEAAFSQLIQRCLAHDPKDRPQTAAHIATTLRRELAPLPRTRRWIGRHPGKVLGAALLFATLGLTGITFAALRPPYSERQIESGLRLHQQGRYRDAVQHFNDALQADPANNAARFARARAHQQLGAADKGNYNLAIQDYLTADERNPDGRNKAALAYCLNRTDGRSEVAVQHYQDAIRSGFATAEVYNNLGFNQLRLAKVKEARQNLDRALELDPGLQAAYHNRARAAYVHALSNHLNELKPMAQKTDSYSSLLAGIADAQKAIELGTGSAELSFDAARLCAVATRVEQRWAATALQHLEKAIKQGFDPAVCKEGDIFNPLRNQDAFQKLTNRPATGQPLPPTRRIVDPIKEPTR